MALSDNWKGFWSSDDSANRQADSSGNGSDLLLAGALTNPTITTTGGKPAAYRNYNNTSSGNVVSGSTVSMSFTSGGGIDLPFSWCCFIYLNSITGVVQHIFSKNNTGTPLFEWDVYIGTTGVLGFRCFNGASSTNYIGIQSSTALTAGQWYFLAGDYNGSKTNAGFRLFRNGILDTTAPLSSGAYVGMTSNAVLFKIGCNASVATFTNFFNGRMDMLGVRSSLFTLEEVYLLYNGGRGTNPFVQPSLRDNWRGFWSSDLGINDDNSGYNMTLIPPGSNATPPFIEDTGLNRFRMYDPSLFNADLVSNSYANTSFTAGGGVDLAFGWSCWIFINAFGAIQTIFSKRTSGGTQVAEWQVQLTAAGLLQFSLFGSTTGSININVTSTTPLNVEQVYFLAGDYDGSKTTGGMRLFVDAVQIATTPTTAGSYAGMTTSTAPLIIGASFSTLYINFLNANLDAIGVRGTTFTYDELTQLYNGGNSFSPVTPALSENWIAWWGSDTLSSDFTGDAPGQVQGVLNDGAAGVPTLVSIGGRPDRYHTFNGVNDNYNTRFGSGLGLMNFTDGAGNDQAFTTTCWFFTNNNATGQALISKRENTVTPGHGWSISYSSALGGISFNLYSDAVGTIFMRGLVPFVPVITQWYHIVTTYDGSKLGTGMKIYIDGVEQTVIASGAGTYTGIFSTTSIPVYVGMYKGTPTQNTLNGGIDGVGVRRGVTSQADVTRLYNGGLGLTRDAIFGTIKDKWVAWYNFDNLTANDSTTNKINLDVLAGVPLAGAAGKIGQAATISSTTYLGRIAPFANFSFPNTQFSISFWINPSGLASGTPEGVLAKGIGTNDREWIITQSSGIRARFFTKDASNYIGATTSTAPMIDGVWQHIVINKENNLATGNIQIYHNGVQQAGNTLDTLGTYGGMQPNNGAFEVGTTVTPAVQRANGLYDLIGIRNQSLTQDQILQLYNAGAGYNLFPPATKPTMIQFF